MVLILLLPGQILDAIFQILSPCCHFFWPEKIPQPFALVTVSKNKSKTIIWAAIFNEIQVCDITVINQLTTWQGNFETPFWYQPAAPSFMWPELLTAWLINALLLAVCGNVHISVWVSWVRIEWSGWCSVPRGVTSIVVALVEFVRAEGPSGFHQGDKILVTPLW